MNLPENDENAEAAMEIITVRTERNSDVIDSSGNLSPGYANVTNHAWMPINREKKTKIKINKMKKKWSSGICRYQWQPRASSQHLIEVILVGNCNCTNFPPG